MDRDSEERMYPIPIKETEKILLMCHLDNERQREKITLIVIVGGMIGYLAKTSPCVAESHSKSGY